MEARFEPIVRRIEQAATTVLLHVQRHTGQEPHDLSDEDRYDDFESLLDHFVKRARREISRLGDEQLMVEYVRTECYPKYVEQLEEIHEAQWPQSLDASTEAAISCTFERCVLMAVVKESIYQDADDEDFERDFEHFLEDDYPMLNEYFRELMEANRELIEAQENRDGCLQVFEEAFGPY